MSWQCRRQSTNICQVNKTYRCGEVDESIIGRRVGTSHHVIWTEDGKEQGRPISESKAQGRRNKKAKGCKCQAFPGVQVFNGIFKVSSPEALVVGQQESGCELCLLGRTGKVLQNFSPAMSVRIASKGCSFSAILQPRKGRNWFLVRIPRLSTFSITKSSLTFASCDQICRSCDSNIPEHAELPKGLAQWAERCGRRWDFVMETTFISAPFPDGTWGPALQFQSSAKRVRARRL